MPTSRRAFLKTASASAAMLPFLKVLPAAAQDPAHALRRYARLGVVQ